MCSEDFGYDTAVVYKANDFESALDAACAGGVDVYFDNTAGPVSDSVMRRLNVGARVVICGTASISSDNGFVRNAPSSRARAVLSESAGHRDALLLHLSPDDPPQDRKDQDEVEQEFQAAMLHAEGAGLEPRDL
jgi:NADPH:quinone reductase-like Zn-dependent oxidoreductase